MNIEEIKKRAKKHIKFTEHAKIEISNDNFKVKDVITAIKNAEIIETYETHKPFPSCLIYGKFKKRHIHIVCALPEHIEMLIIITVYEPDKSKWLNFKVRKINVNKKSKKKELIN